jgi:membrane dipeptidase
MLPIADLHTHPLLPMYYFRKDLGNRQRPARFFPYTPFGTHIDIPRLKESGVRLIVCCVYALNRLPYRDCFEAAKAQIAMFEEWLAEHAETFEHAKNPADLERIVGAGKIAAVLALEGGHHLAGRLDTLPFFKAAGVFYVTLVHFLNNGIAESSLFTDWTPEPPLRPFGREVVAEMNRLGLVVDVAHCSETAFWEVMEHSKAPPIYSHGGASALCPHHRNLTDDQARAIAERGGLLGLILYPRYLRRHALFGRMDDAIRHLEHWMKVAGPDSIAIGSDMSGVMVVKDVKDYAHMPRLREAVVAAFGEPLARRILYDNAVDYMKRCWGQTA